MDELTRDEERIQAVRSELSTIGFALELEGPNLSVPLSARWIARARPLTGEREIAQVVAMTPLGASERLLTRVSRS